MWTIADPRCLVSGHIVTDFTHRGTAYRMCHRCGKIMPLAAIPVPVIAGADRFGRPSRNSLGLSKVNR